MMIKLQNGLANYVIKLMEMKFGLFFAQIVIMIFVYHVLENNIKI